MQGSNENNYLFNMQNGKLRMSEDYSKISVDLIDSPIRSNLNILNAKLLLTLPNIEEVYFYHFDYKTIVYISRIFRTNKRSKKFVLVDDDLMIDRCYIKPLPNGELYIPVRFQMWGLNQPMPNCKFYSYNLPSIDYSYVDKDIQSLEYLPFVTQIARDLLAIYPYMSDLEKMLITLNYFEADFQYVAGKVSLRGDTGVENVTPTYNSAIYGSVYSVNTLIERGIGLCHSMAILYMLLLNNPIMKINCGIIATDEHVYNWVEYNNQIYIVDPTWSITRNDYQNDIALKAKRFCDKYFLIGEDVLREIDHHQPKGNYNISPKSVERSKIDEARQHLESLGVSFEYGNKVNIPSYCRKLKK